MHIVLLITTNPLIILQKKVIRIITFSYYREYTNPIFSKLNIIKLPDLIFFHNAIFMYDYHHGNLPNVFNLFFTKVSQTHSYKTRLASKLSFCLTQVRTNYGKFSIRYIGAKVWN